MITWAVVAPRASACVPRIVLCATIRTSAGWKPANPTRDRAGASGRRFRRLRSIRFSPNCLSRVVSVRTASKPSRRTRKLPGTNSSLVAINPRPGSWSLMATLIGKETPSFSPSNFTFGAATAAGTVVGTARIPRRRGPAPEAAPSTGRAAPQTHPLAQILAIARYPQPIFLAADGCKTTDVNRRQSAPLVLQKPPNRR